MLHCDLGLKLFEPVATVPSAELLELTEIAAVNLLGLYR
jgi:hypothetical protein